MKVKYLLVCAFLSVLLTSCTDLSKEELEPQNIKELNSEKIKSYTGDEKGNGRDDEYGEEV